LESDHRSRIKILHQRSESVPDANLSEVQISGSPEIFSRRSRSADLELEVQICRFPDLELGAPDLQISQIWSSRSRSADFRIWSSELQICRFPGSGARGPDLQISRIWSSELQICRFPGSGAQGPDLQISRIWSSRSRSADFPIWSSRSGFGVQIWDPGSGSGSGPLSLSKAD